MYNITSANNTIVFTEGVSTATARLPVGSYNITNLIDAVDAVMTSASPNAYTYTSSYSSLTLFMTISSTGNFTFNWANANATAYAIMGYNKVNTTSAASHTSTNAINLSYPQYLFISIDDVALEEGPWLAQVPVPVGTGQLVYNSINTQYPNKKLSNTTTGIFEIQLRLWDQNLNEITSLLGNTWSTTIIFKFDY